jgi:hypothetical protein
MKKQKTLPQLVLNRETIRQLDEPALAWAAGGISGPHCPATFPRLALEHPGGADPKQA